MIRSKRNRRGVALLLVMIALVVGMILTAGYLATQSTANGITRNQKSIGQTRMIAESGVDSCVWLIKNKSDWRRTMTPGTWINNMSVNGGMLTVTVTDGAGNASFVTDNTQAAMVHSTATYNGESVSVQAIVTPSGGGRPWQNGLFVNSGPVMQDTSSIDAYNPLAGLYPLSRLLSAIVGTGGSGPGCNGCSGSVGGPCGCGKAGCGGSYPNCQGGMVMKDFSSVYGTAMGTVGNLLNTLLGGLFTTQPSTVTTAPENRTLGIVIPPNVAGFIAGGVYSKNSNFTAPNGGQTYDSFAILKPGAIGTTTMTVTKNTVYYIKGNFTMDQSTTIKVNTGNTVTFYVAGNTDIQGNVLLVGTGQFLLYAAGSVDIHGSALLNSQSTSGQALILGLPTNSSITVRNSAAAAAGIYAPKAIVQLSNSATLYGSVVGQSVQMANSSSIHLDDAIKNRYFHQIKGGTTQGDYTVTWVRSNGSNH